MLTEYSDELAELFMLGEEIETYKTVSELQEKLTYYLEHDAEREKIAAKGHAKFLQHYTWPQRMKALLEAVTLKQ